MPPGTQPVKAVTAIQASRGLNATVRRAVISSPIAQARLNQGQGRHGGGIGAQNARPKREPDCAGAIKDRCPFLGREAAFGADQQRHWPGAVPGSVAATMRWIFTRPWSVIDTSAIAAT